MRSVPQRRRFVVNTDLVNELVTFAFQLNSRIYELVPKCPDWTSRVVTNGMMCVRIKLVSWLSQEMCPNWFLYLKYKFKFVFSFYTV